MKLQKAIFLNTKRGTSNLIYFLECWDFFSRNILFSRCAYFCLITINNCKINLWFGARIEMSVVLDGNAIWSTLFLFTCSLISLTIYFIDIGTHSSFNYFYFGIFFINMSKRLRLTSKCFNPFKFLMEFIILLPLRKIGFIFLFTC